jgi:hypothetical protein
MIQIIINMEQVIKLLILNTHPPAAAAVKKNKPQFDPSN